MPTASFVHPQLITILISVFQIMSSMSPLPCSFVHILHRTQYSGYKKHSGDIWWVKNMYYFLIWTVVFWQDHAIREENYCKNAVFLTDSKGRKCSGAWKRPRKATEIPPEIIANPILDYPSLSVSDFAFLYSPASFIFLCRFIPLPLQA